MGEIELAQQEWRTMTRKYLIEPAVLEPTVTLVANDNWIEYTLRYVVNYKQRRSVKNRLFTCILDDIDASAGKDNMASATFLFVEKPVFRHAHQA